MSEFKKFRNLVRTDFLLMHGLYTDLDRRVGGLQESVSSLERNVARLNGDVSGMREVTRKVVGQSRQSNERWDKMLEAMDGEFTPASETAELRRRLEAIERKLAS